MDIELEEIKSWKSIRKEIKNNFDYNQDWKNAINLFQTRLERKFFNPIEELIKTNKQEGEGFTIVTAQCALIESLASFRTGEIFNHKKRKNAPAYEYNESKKMFVNFLLKDSIFKNNFWSEVNGKPKENSPCNASDFYSDVRCGLMHEARTKNNWYINTTTRRIKTDKQFLELQDGKIRIYRSILHYRLKHAVKNYCSDLKARDRDGENLRKMFGRKLDHLFDIKRDKSYEWWK